MDLIRQGDLLLKGTGGPDGETRLVSTLLRIYPAYPAEQIAALVRKPKPLVLIRGINEENAGKLVEELRPYGVSLQFRPSSKGDTTTAGPEATGSAKAEPIVPPEHGPRQEGVPGPRKEALFFTGSADEYFRIWIVNVALTILTLGIYGAWAKVRTRRYFHANTLLDGQPFDYLARPGTILKGHIIVAGALVAMNVSGRISPLVGSVVTVAGWSLVPYLLYKAHRFKARNTAYRNIRFRFRGSAWGAYKAYALIPLAFLIGFAVAMFAFIGGQQSSTSPGVPNMMGVGIMVVMAGLFALSFPYFIYLQRRYLHDNFCYGRTGSRFGGRSGRFYGIYLRASLMMIGAFFAGGLIMGIMVPMIIGLSGAGGKPNAIAIFGVGFISYAVFFLFILLVQQYIYASVFNYAWGNTRLGSVSFDASLKAGELAWIRLTNVLAIVFTLGLLAPWAKIRRARYILPRTLVTLPGDMSTFLAAEDQKEGAVGDTAADFFDWDIGW
jgi:uncharacterized membrane protein YjgN (DUF898 family)